jgi:hypothetical protein
VESADTAAIQHRIGLTGSGEFRLTAVQLYHLGGGLADRSFIHDRDDRSHRLNNLLMPLGRVGFYSRYDCGLSTIGICTQLPMKQQLANEGACGHVLQNLS